MIITIKKGTTQQEIENLKQQFVGLDISFNYLPGEHHDVFGLVGDTARLDERKIQAYECVENVTRIAAPYKLANRQFHPQDSVIKVGQIAIGGDNPVVVIGGPCSVESVEQIHILAQKVSECGGVMLRGGAYKPRTSPYAFQGMQTQGIIAMKEAGKQFNLPIVSEIMSSDKIAEFDEHVDLIQVGARNMQNFELLKALGKAKKPILLKRGLSNTIEEWIMSAEYIMASGNPNVILCERGIRTFEKYTRNTLDLSAIPVIKERTHLPIIIDPSHATGDWKLVESMSLAAVAAGADGLIIEVHHTPECALSDGAQSLKPEKFKRLIDKVKAIAQAIGREVA